MPFKMTFGYELELGDIRRDRKVPEHLGAWEYAETDIVNLCTPYQYLAVDPLGKEPPVGGEINIKPGRSSEEVAERVAETIAWFQNRGDAPSASCVNHGHVHVRVVGLRDDIKALKRLTSWVKHNQDDLIKDAYGFEERAGMGYTKTARTYLKWDGGRPMPDWMSDNIIEQARDFEDFIRIQCCGKDGKSRGRPFRYAVNTYCLKHIDTVEFRCLRCSLLYDEILGSLRMAEVCLREALEGKATFKQIMQAEQFPLPPFTYHQEAYLGWETTKYGKERGHKQRELLPL